MPPGENTAVGGIPRSAGKICKFLFKINMLRLVGGSCEIRTHGTFLFGSFQDCWFKPLTQASKFEYNSDHGAVFNN